MMDWRYLVLFDGECGLCNHGVQWMMRHDRRGVLNYAPLQGDTARPYVGGATRFDTMIFVEKQDDGRERVFERSRAVLSILRHLGGIWRCFSWFRFLPAFLTDLPYRIVARYRKSFAHSDACQLPDAGSRARFLP